MLGQTELAQLAGDKRRLIEECDRERSAFRQHGQQVVAKLHWAEQIHHLYQLARPAVLVGASVVGWRAVSLMSRAVRLLGGAFWVLKQGRRLFRRAKTR